MFWPNEAQRQAGLFECEYAKLRETFVSFGLVPPSRETVFEDARRDPHRDVFAVMQRMRMRLSTK